jgi:hypothetical protein
MVNVLPVHARVAELGVELEPRLDEFVRRWQGDSAHLWSGFDRLGQFGQQV